MEEKHLQNIIENVQNLELFKILGLEFLRLNKGLCEMYLPSACSLNNPNSKINMGIYSAVCDFASFVVSCTTLTDGEQPETYSTNVSVLSAVDKGGLKICSSVIEAEYGSVIESKIFDDTGKLIALGNLRY